MKLVQAALDSVRSRASSSCAGPGDGSQRSSGPHVSDIIRRIARKMKMIRGSAEVFNPLMMELGVAWESYLASQWSDLWFHPGEIEKDGIYGNPDAVGPGYVCEFKLTWKSSSRPVEQSWIWWAQLKAYCHMLGLGRGVLVVMYVMGDYRSSGPQLVWHEADFDLQELLDNWRLIVEEARCDG